MPALAVILADLNIAIGVAKMAADLAVDAAPYVEQIYRLWNGGSLTDDERAALEAKSAELSDLIANA